MKIIKEGGHRLFENDPETARYVADLLVDLRRRGLEAVRDYYVVENEIGERFWVYRSGDGLDPETGDRQWYMHGIFA